MPKANQPVREIWPNPKQYQFLTSTTRHTAYGGARGGGKSWVAREQAVEVIERVDKLRENYIQRFAGVSRYDARNYDLVLNSDGHTEEQLADLILSYIG